KVPLRLYRGYPVAPTSSGAGTRRTEPLAPQNRMVRRNNRTMRKVLTVLATIVMCSQGYSLQVQRAASVQTNSPALSAPVNHQMRLAEEVLDSQKFFETALKVRNEVPDPTSKVEALLARMTLDEKV